MAEQAQDRHLPATERKIRKAREEGQVARSRDLSHLVVLGLGVALLAAASTPMAQWLQQFFAAALRFDALAIERPEQMVDRLAWLGAPAIALVLALGSLLTLAGLAGAVLSGGWNFSFKALLPSWQKLSPVAGLGRMFSLQQLATMGKACLLALLLALIGTLYLRANLGRFEQLLAMPLPAGMAEAGGIVGTGLALLLLPLAAFAVVDVPLQRLLLMRRLRMSHDEMRKEMKDVDGNQAVKGKIRARMREVAQRRMMAAVPGADLVVMNPTHFAVALKYDERQMAAPRVVAKGVDLVALRIRDLARASGVPVLQAPPLARALYAHTELEQEVPAALFAAVAQVLAWVFQLRQASPHGQARAALLASPPQPEIDPQLDPLRAPSADADRA